MRRGIPARPSYAIQAALPLTVAGSHKFLDHSRSNSKHDWGGGLHAHSINMRIFTLIEYYLPLGSKNYEEKWLQTQSIGFANQLALH